MSRVGRYLALRFAAALAGISAVVAVVLAGLVPDLAPRASPWVAVTPIAIVAAVVCRRRTRSLGEDRAISIAGVGPVAELAPSALVLALFAVVAYSVPSPMLAPDRMPEPPAVVAGLDGSLVLLRDDPPDAIWMRSDGRLERLASPVPPPEFVRQPRRPWRFVGQLFVMRSPFDPSEHAYDPVALRWAFALLGFVGALMLLRAGR